MGAELLAAALDDIAAGREKPEPQDDALASYCGMIKKEDGLVDWNLGARELDRKLRAYSPWPGIHSSFQGLRLSILEASVIPPGEPLPALDEGPRPCGKVLSIDKKRGILVQTGEGLLALTRLQLEKKKALSFMDFVNGTRGIAGAILGAAAPIQDGQHETAR